MPHPVTCLVCLTKIHLFSPAPSTHRDTWGAHCGCWPAGWRQHSMHLGPHALQPPPCWSTPWLTHTTGANLRQHSTLTCSCAAMSSTCCARLCWWARACNSWGLLQLGSCSLCKQLPPEQQQLLLQHRECHTAQLHSMCLPQALPALLLPSMQWQPCWPPAQALQRAQKA